MFSGFGVSSYCIACGVLVVKYKAPGSIFQFWEGLRPIFADSGLGPGPIFKYVYVFVAISMKCICFL